MGETLSNAQERIHWSPQYITTMQHLFAVNVNAEKNYERNTFAVVNTDATDES